MAERFETRLAGQSAVHAAPQKLPRSCAGCPGGSPPLFLHVAWRVLPLYRLLTGAGFRFKASETDTRQDICPVPSRVEARAAVSAGASVDVRKVFVPRTGFGFCARAGVQVSLECSAAKQLRIG